jgi:ATP-dependent DNA ligase
MLVTAMQPGSWLYEIKFDGYRTIALRGANETRILSRNKKDLRKKFPGIVESVAALHPEKGRFWIEATTTGKGLTLI